MEVRLGNQVFKLEVAEDPSDQERGLMYRPAGSLKDDEGMIFVFPHEDLRMFHNRNVEFDIDVVFIEARQTVVDIRQLTKGDPTPVPGRGPAKWVIELNRGMAERAGLKLGDRVELPERVTAPRTTR